MSTAFGTKGGWKEWVAYRDGTLRDPYGWLTLVESVWLSDQPQKLENFPGTWSAQGNTVTAVFESADQSASDAGAPESADEGDKAKKKSKGKSKAKKKEPELKVYREGQLVEGPLVIEVDPEGSDRTLRDETGREAEVTYRFTGPVVRIRDPRAKCLEDYLERGSLDRYGFRKEWVLRGRLLPYDEPEEIEVGTAIPGATSKLRAWARADFALPEDEQPISLVVTGSGPDSSAVIFYDETNGDTTPGWREAQAAIDGETVVVDFNRASIFPSHMTPHGTCPKPPEENRILRRVEAGEKTFNETT